MQEGRKEELISVLEDSTNSSVLFDLAEQLFEEGKIKEALPFYKILCDDEQVRISEKTSIAHYRIFLASLGNGSEDDWKAVNRFDPFIKQLPDHIQLDALLQVARTCYTLQKWDELGKYCDHLRTHVAYIYSMLTMQGGVKELLKTKYPLVVYYGQSFLLKGTALRKIGKYAEAKEYVKGYENLQWFEISDESSKKEIEQFRVFAKGNMYTLDLYLGNAQILDEFINFISALKRDADLLAGVLTIIEAANMHNYEVTHILEVYSKKIELYKGSDNPVWQSQYYQFCYQRAIYECGRGNFKPAIDDILNCLAHSANTNHTSDFKKCIMLYWKFRNEASDEQENRFSTILGGLNHEKVFVCSGSDNGVV